MLRKFGRFLFGLGPSRVLVLILGPSFIIYGIGLFIVGEESPLIHVLGLPVAVYALMFVIGGFLKLSGLHRGWDQFGHTVGVTIALFWAMVIVVLSPNPAGWISSLPWFSIGIICMFAAIWPTPFRIRNRFPPPKIRHFDGIDISVPVVPPIVERYAADETDPAMRAIDYVSKLKSAERADNERDSS